MSNIFQFPTPIPMTNGNYPQFKFAVFGDNLATVTTAGYLNATVSASGGSLSNADVVMALYSFNQQTTSGSFGIFTVSVATSTGQITLTAWGNPGDVVLPTTANYLAHFTNTSGTLSSAPDNVTNAGNIAAGLSGTAGTLASFPGTASKGSLVVAAVANTGNTVTTISNAAMGQASVVSIPDPGTATADFALAPAALVNGNLIKASGTAGLIADAGILATSIATYTSPTIANHIATYTNTSGNISDDAATAINGGNIQAGLSGTAGTVASFPGTASKGSLVLAAVANTGNTNTTISNAAMGQASVISIPDPAGATADFVLAPAALVSGNFVKASGTAGLVADGGAAIHAGVTTTYAGGGTSNAFTVAGMATGWVVTASNLTSTNSVSITKVVPSTNTLTITWSGDPGASTTVNWIALTAGI